MGTEHNMNPENIEQDEASTIAFGKAWDVSLRDEVKRLLPALGEEAESKIFVLCFTSFLAGQRRIVIGN